MSTGVCAWASAIHVCMRSKPKARLPFTVHRPGVARRAVEERDLRAGRLRRDQQILDGADLPRQRGEIGPSLGMCIPDRCFPKWAALMCRPARTVAEAV